MSGRWHTINGWQLREYLSCARKPYMRTYRPFDAQDLPREQAAVIASDLDLGLAHEAAVGLARHPATASPPSGARLPEQAEWTLAAMRRGEPKIYQGVLRWRTSMGNPEWWGAPDWLVRKPGASAFGNWYYSADDAKAGRRASRDIQIVPVAYYCLLLEKIQGTRPDFKLLREFGRVEYHRTTDHEQRVLSTIADLSMVLGDGRDPGTQLASRCRNCEFNRACTTDAERLKHLTLLPGLRKEQLATLERLEIHSVSDLARRTPDAIVGTGGFPDPGRVRLLIERARAIDTGDARLVGRVEIPAPEKVEVFIDIENEGLTNHDDGFLFGVLVRRGKRATYWSSLATTAREQRRAAREFRQKLLAFPDCRVFHYGPHERGFVTEHDLQARLFDVYSIVRENAALPVKGTGLKDVAKALGFRWREANLDGRVIPSLWYSMSGASKRHQSRVRARLRRYNEDDLRALLHVVDWIRSVWQAAVPK